MGRNTGQQQKRSTCRRIGPPSDAAYFSVDDAESFSECRYDIIAMWRDRKTNTFYRLGADWDTRPWGGVALSEYFRPVKIDATGNVREKEG